MTRYRKMINDRKVLVNRLAVLTGQEPRYTRVPRCAYEVGPYTVEKDGELTVPDECKNDSIIQTLAAEGLIGEGRDVAQPARVVTVQRAAAEEQRFQAAQAEQVSLGTEDWEPDEEEDDEGDTATVMINSTEIGQESQAVWQADADILSGLEIPLPDELAAEEATESTQEEETREEVEETEAEAADETVLDTGGGDGTDIDSDGSDTDTGDEPEPQDTPDIPTGAVVSLPLTGHTAESLKNLVTMIYSKGALISKATGGVFVAEKDLVDAILDENSLHSVNALRGFLAGYEQEYGSGILGMKVGEDRIVFDGFPDRVDADHVKTFTQLVSCMARTAKKQKRVVARETEAENERYSMRTWLLRIGMNGPEFKEARKHLMENLTGHTAFRTAEEAERAKTKAQKKRDEMKAAKAAEAAGAVEAETPVEAEAQTQLLEAGA